MGLNTVNLGISDQKFSGICKIPPGEYEKQIYTRENGYWHQGISSRYRV